jgi:hypothetical protein
VLKKKKKKKKKEEEESCRGIQMIGLGHLWLLKQSFDYLYTFCLINQEF